MRRYSSLTPLERSAAARRLRLEWASSGDRDHAAGVARMIEDGARAMRRAGVRPVERAPVELEDGPRLEAVA